MADIEAIRKAIDGHLALHVEVLGAKADADTVVAEATEVTHKAQTDHDTVCIRAKKTYDNAVVAADQKRDNVITEALATVATAHAAVVAAEEASETFRAKVREELGVELPTYGEAVSSGTTRL